MTDHNGYGSSTGCMTVALVPAAARKRLRLAETLVDRYPDQVPTGELREALSGTQREGDDA